MASPIRSIKKTIYTLNVPPPGQKEYAPEITRITYPLLRHYAKRIGADFHIITERKFPGWPVVYEKLQIYTLGVENHDDWLSYIDSDALVHPETPDWTEFLRPDTVAHNGTDMAAIRWRYDDYFRRDGRNIGSCNWNTIASSMCRDLWTPLDITLEQAIENIYPTVEETLTVVERSHLIDDYTLSRNIARYGLKVKTLLELQKDIGLASGDFYDHLYTLPIDKKVEHMNEVLKRWRVDQFLERWK